MDDVKVKKIADQSSQGSLDLISDLHEDVMNLILVRLPIRDVVRMSILSKKWRYKWVSIPDIVFDKESLIEGAPKLEHAYVVDQVLMHHVGPIYNFSCMSGVPSCSGHLIDSWIVFLSRKGIKKLILMLDFKEDRYGVPSSIFNCQELCHLELFNCRLRVPPTFKGFHNLLVLNLNVSISEDDIACLISKCPLLEMLELVTWNCDRCHIHAPNLRYLKLIGNFRDLALGSTPLLTNVFIDFYMPPYSWDDLKQGNTCSSIQFIGRPNGIERLSLKGCSIQFLSIGHVPKKLSTTYECLKYLEVDIELNSKEILATLCILRSSPNLKELKIEYCLDEVEGRYDLLAEGAEFWGAETQSDYLLSHLRAVEIVGLAMLVDLEFIRYILSNAPVLETMKLYTCQFVEAKEVSRILEELFRFRRASTANIIYLGHYKGS